MVLGKEWSEFRGSQNMIRKSSKDLETVPDLLFKSRP